MEQQDQRLAGVRIAALMTDGFEQAEFTGPRDALLKEGASVSVISNKLGKVQGVHHVQKGDAFDVDLAFEEADPDDFDAVLLPGGVVNADQIRIVPAAQQFVRSMQEDGKTIAVICHGAWLLVSAGLVKGHTLTSWPTLQDDIRNAGGNWVNEQVVEDGNWISSRRPGDIPAFNEHIIHRLSQALSQSARGTADESRAPLSS
ncbi:MAG: type 1 glutamine amidotransferase [Burkholderiales bacterium]|nr:type 1 glutamine amidotransferase [Burkholderiales bacterium]